MQRNYGPSYNDSYGGPNAGRANTRLGQPSSAVVRVSPVPQHRAALDQPSNQHWTGNHSPQTTRHASRTMVVKQVQSGPSGTFSAQKKVVMETVTSSDGTQKTVTKEMVTTEGNVPEMSTHFRSMNFNGRSPEPSHKVQHQSYKLEAKDPSPYRANSKDPFHTREFVVKPTAQRVVVTPAKTVTVQPKTVVVEPTKTTKASSYKPVKTEATGSRAGKQQASGDFTSDVIKAHNMYRRKHGKVGDIRHNREMSAIAQKWAEHLAAINTMKHSGDTYKGKPLGENVAAKWGSGNIDYSGADVTEQWYNEIKKFDFRRNQFSSGTGHFTQVVWKGSKEIGVGKAASRSGGIFVVCNYFPAGNMMGTFQDNVFPA